MIPALRSEFKKILTIRSTYAISIFFLLLLGAITFYGQGYKTLPKDIDSHLLAGTLTVTANIASIAGALIALLLMAHEYRYNTITYSLSSVNSRGKVLTAKILSVLSFVFIYSLVVAAIGLILTAAGVLAAGHNLPHQEINYLLFFAKSVFFCECYALVGLLIATLVRNMPAAIVILFIVPNTIESLLGLIIKHPEKWLPFLSLSHVVDPAITPTGNNASSLISPVRGGTVFLIYLVSGWIIAWYLFLRRDAN